VYFAAKGEIVYGAGTKGVNMYFLVRGSARTEITMNLVSRQKIPLGLKNNNHGVTKDTKVLTGHLDHLPGAVFGDCSSLLGFTREETLVADEDCVFLSLDAKNMKKSMFITCKRYSRCHPDGV
jgi:CRP-like cAMP-binding protein